VHERIVLTGRCAVDVLDEQDFVADLVVEGQVTNPVHTEDLKLFYTGLLKSGITKNEIKSDEPTQSSDTARTQLTHTLRKGRPHGS
jgi:hypothetical protein